MSEASLFLVYRVVSASRLWLDVSSALGAVASSEIMPCMSMQQHQLILSRVSREFHVRRTSARLSADGKWTALAEMRSEGTSEKMKVSVMFVDSINIATQ